MEELLVSWSNKQREHINRPVLWNRVKGESSKLCATDLHKRLSLRVTIIMSIGEITKCAGGRVDMSTHSFIRSLNVASGWPEPAIQPTAINFNKSNYLPTYNWKAIVVVAGCAIKMGLGFTRAHHLWSCYHENASQLVAYANSVTRFSPLDRELVKWRKTGNSVFPDHLPNKYINWGCQVIVWSVKFVEQWRGVV